MVQTSGNSASAGAAFPFLLSDIAFWVCRRKDGTMVKYQVLPVTQTKGSSSLVRQTPVSQSSYASSAYCTHDPKVGKFVWRTPDKSIELYMADYYSGSKYYDQFDLALDCGKVISPVYAPVSKVKSALRLVNKLQPHVVPEPNTKTTNNVIWIDWIDRAAPPVYPEFWSILAEQIQELRNLKQKQIPGDPLRVLCICQGGHGRSGTSFVNLLMCLSNLSPLDAITVLRACHCARSIESVDQHNYINLVGEFLGRPMDANEAGKVTDFKARLLSLDNPTYLAEVQSRFEVPHEN